MHAFAREVLNMSRDRLLLTLSDSEFRFLRDAGYGIRADTIVPRIDSRIVIVGFRGFAEPVPGTPLSVYG